VKRLVRDLGLGFGVSEERYLRIVFVLLLGLSRRPFGSGPRTLCYRGCLCDLGVCG
jgi:hypothetical protein